MYFSTLSEGRLRAWPGTPLRRLWPLGAGNQIDDIDAGNSSPWTRPFTRNREDHHCDPSGRQGPWTSSSRVSQVDRSQQIITATRLVDRNRGHHLRGFPRPTGTVDIIFEGFPGRQEPTDHHCDPSGRQEPRTSSSRGCQVDRSRGHHLRGFPRSTGTVDIIYEGFPGRQEPTDHHCDPSGRQEPRTSSSRGCQADRSRRHHLRRFARSTGAVDIIYEDFPGRQGPWTSSSRVSQVDRDRGHHLRGVARSTGAVDIIYEDFPGRQGPWTSSSRGCQVDRSRGHHLRGVARSTGAVDIIFEGFPGRQEPWTSSSRVSQVDRDRGHHLRGVARSTGAVDIIYEGLPGRQEPWTSSTRISQADRDRGHHLRGFPRSTGTVDIIFEGLPGRQEPWTSSTRISQADRDRGHHLRGFPRPTGTVDIIFEDFPGRQEPTDHPCDPSGRQEPRKSSSRGCQADRSRRHHLRRFARSTGAVDIIFEDFPGRQGPWT